LLQIYNRYAMTGTIFDATNTTLVEMS
jgi:hypothetical protein